jgi:hypothetical protein
MIGYVILTIFSRFTTSSRLYLTSRSRVSIADLVDRYNVASKEGLYEAIKSKKISSHSAWKDYIVLKNKEKYIKDLKVRLGRVQ